MGRREGAPGRAGASGRRGPRALRCLLAALLALAAPASALVVAPGDDAATLAAPPDGAPWRHVGKLGGTSAVYLGDGWVITAAHAGAGTVWFGGAAHPLVADSQVHVGNGEGAAEPTADLLVFRVSPAPDLPALQIASESPRSGESVTLVGFGHGRGEEIRWRGEQGFRWDASNRQRWGHTVVAGLFDLRQAGWRTHAFATRFHPGSAPFEAHAARGDSGGAGFIRRGGVWQLAGVMVSVGGPSDQQRDTSVWGNFTYLADLARYRETVLGITGTRAARPDSAHPTSFARVVKSPRGLPRGS